MRQELLELKRINSDTQFERWFEKHKEDKALLSEAVQFLMSLQYDAESNSRKAMMKVTARMSFNVNEPQELKRTAAMYNRWRMKCMNFLR